MERIVKAVMIVLGVIIVTVASYGYVTGPLAQYGFIEGKVTVGPFCPVEPPSGCPPPPGTYTSRRLVLQPSLGKKVLVSLNETGYFEARVAVGTYEVTLTNCTFLGCSRALPVTVVVKRNQISTVDIEIDTGIR